MIRQPLIGCCRRPQPAGAASEITIKIRSKSGIIHSLGPNLNPNPNPAPNPNPNLATFAAPAA